VWEYVSSSTLDHIARLTPRHGEFGGVEAPAFAGRRRSGDVEFDMQLGTAEFLELEPEFRHAGIILIQLHSPVPDTLSPGRGSDVARYRILKDNGLHLEFHLPQRGEYAAVVSPDRGVLEAIAVRLQPFNGDLP